MLAVKADLTVKDDVDRLVKEAMSTFGNIDILVFNAGPPKPGTFSQLSEDDWEYATRLLLLSAVWLTKRVVNNMVSRGGWGGRLIYVTSLTLRQPIPNLVLSNTVRLSLAGLVKSLAVEYGQYGITANGIMQGYIMTERINQLAQEELGPGGVLVLMRLLRRGVGRYRRVGMEGLRKSVTWLLS